MQVTQQNPASPSGGHRALDTAASLSLQRVHDAASRWLDSCVDVIGTALVSGVPRTAAAPAGMNGSPAGRSKAVKLQLASARRHRRQLMQSPTPTPTQVQIPCQRLPVMLGSFCQPAPLALTPRTSRMLHVGAQAMGFHAALADLHRQHATSLRIQSAARIAHAIPYSACECPPTLHPHA